MEQFAGEYVISADSANDAFHYQDVRSSAYKPPVLVLTELNPLNIIEGSMRDGAFVSEDDIKTCGAMRETCPYCEDSHLQLVLRQKSVKAAHLFCQQCTRCYHASYQDGSPALTLA